MLLILFLFVSPVLAANKNSKPSRSRAKQTECSKSSKKRSAKTSKRRSRKLGMKNRYRVRARYVSSAESLQQKKEIAAITAQLEEHPDLSGDVPELSAGEFVWPLKYGYISRGVRGRHRGVDMMCFAGYPIYAVADGVVETISINNRNYSGYGKMVIIRHDDKQIRSLYAHCSAIYLHEGQTVRRGQKIAAVGRTGRATGSHLHFEMRGYDGKQLNPLKYLPSIGALGHTYVPH